MGRKKTEINPECGKRVAEWIEFAGITQKRLAKDLAYTPQQISRIVQGKSRLTEEVARKIVGLYKPDSVLDQFRYEYLMCYDDVRTEAERVKDTIQARTDMRQHIINAWESRGYKATYTRFLCLFNGDRVVFSYGPDVTPEWAYNYEQENGNTNIPKGIPYKQLIDKASSDGLHFAYEYKVGMCVPGIGTHYCTQSEYTDIINEIAQFIDFKFQSLFNHAARI